MAWMRFFRKKKNAYNPYSPYAPTVNQGTGVIDNNIFIALGII